MFLTVLSSLPPAGRESHRRASAPPATTVSGVALRAPAPSSDASCYRHILRRARLHLNAAIIPNVENKAPDTMNMPAISHMPSARLLSGMRICVTWAASMPKARSAEPITPMPMHAQYLAPYTSCVTPDELKVVWGRKGLPAARPRLPPNGEARQPKNHKSERSVIDPRPSKAPPTFQHRS